jgi:hypothetical protein
MEDIAGQGTRVLTGGGKSSATTSSYLDMMRISVPSSAFAIAFPMRSRPLERGSDFLPFFALLVA